MRRLSASNLENSFLRSFRRVALTSSDSLCGVFSASPFVQKRLQFGTPQSDHYRTLGVKPDATPDEIKSAYKKLALEFHPDRNKAPGAEDKFKNISEAYSVVGNKSKRKDYDAQRSYGGGFSQQQPSGGRGAGGAYPGNPFMNQNYQSGAQYRQMTKEEADILFRELFGGIQVDQIFKDAERQSNAGRGGFGGMHRINFREFGSSAFRPHIAEESKRSWTDEYGNKMEEKVFTTSDGTKYTVHNHSSTQPGASVNQTSEDFYHSVGGNSADGRAKFGTSSFRVNPRNFTNDFGQNYFGVKTHGRHPLIGLAIIVAWTIVITTLVFGLFSFAFTHPLFVLAIIGLIYLRRMRYY